MSLKSLSKIRSLKDPVKQYQCEFVISKLPAVLLATVTQKVAGLLSGNKAVATAEELRLRCTSYSYPSPKLAQTELIIGGHRRRLGTIQNKSGVWKCTIVEDMEGSVLNLIQAWIDLIHSNMTGTRLPSLSYVGTAQITLGGDADGLNKRTVWLKGFYPIRYTVGEIDPSSSNPISITVEFNYDFYCDNSYSLFALGG